MGHFLINVLGKAIILVMGTAVMVIVFLIYPTIEDRLVKAVHGYLDWAVDTTDKMFQPISRAKLTLWITLLTIVFGSAGFLITYGNGFITVIFTLFFAYMGWSLVRFWISTVNWSTAWG